MRDQSLQRSLPMSQVWPEQRHEASGDAPHGGSSDRAWRERYPLPAWPASHGGAFTVTVHTAHRSRHKVARRFRPPETFTNADSHGRGHLYYLQVLQLGRHHQRSERHGPGLVLQDNVSGNDNAGPHRRYEELYHSSAVNSRRAPHAVTVTQPTSAGSILHCHERNWHHR